MPCDRQNDGTVGTEGWLDGSCGWDNNCGWATEDSGYLGSLR